MNLGQLLAGAGVVGRAWREEEEAQRRAREQELRTAELNRLDRLRQEMLNTKMPETPKVEVPQYGFWPVVEAPSTAAAPAAPAPAAPAPAAPAPAAPAAPAAAAAPAAPAAKPQANAALTIKPRPPEQLKNVPTDQLTAAEWQSLPQAEKLRRLKILNNERQAASDRAQMLKPFAAAADIFVGGPYNAAAKGLTWRGNMVDFARIGRAFGIYEPDVTRVEVPAIGTGTLTPFYDRVRKVEQRNQPLTADKQLEKLKAQDAARAKQLAQIPPTPQPPDPQRLLAAMIQVESSGNPNAVGSKGEVGLMQVRPSTAMKPGFGVPNVFDFAQQMGVKVGQRNEAEAKRLLADPKVGAAYGQQYMSALLQRYNGNLPAALAAYNAGFTNIDRWLANGADPNKLPSRDYVSKVLAALSSQSPSKGAPAASAAPAAASPTSATSTAGLTIPGISTAQAAPLPTAAQPQQEERLSPSQFYLANPQAIPLDMQRALQQREELARLAGMYQRAGMGLQFMEARAKLMELDNNLAYLHGMQGLQELELANDPRRLATVWSQYAGMSVGIQPRTDGKWDILVNGQHTRTGLTSGAIADLARSAFDQAYVQQKAAASAEYNKKAYESMLKTQEKIVEKQLGMQAEVIKQTAEMIQKIAVERTKGNIQHATQIAVEQLKHEGWDVKPTGDGSGNLVFTPPRSSGIPPFVVDSRQLLGGSTTNPDGIRVPVSPSRLVPIPALTR